jgi:hypothetical protein
MSPSPAGPTHGPIVSLHAPTEIWVSLTGSALVSPFCSFPHVVELIMFSTTFDDYDPNVQVATPLCDADNNPLNGLRVPMMVCGRDLVRYRNVKFIFQCPCSLWTVMKWSNSGSTSHELSRRLSRRDLHMQIPPVNALMPLSLYDQRR